MGGPGWSSAERAGSPGRLDVRRALGGGLRAPAAGGERSAGGARGARRRRVSSATRGENRHDGSPHARFVLSANRGLRLGARFRADPERARRWPAMTPVWFRAIRYQPPSRRSGLVRRQERDWCQAASSARSRAASPASAPALLPRSRSPRLCTPDWSSPPASQAGRSRAGAAESGRGARRPPPAPRARLARRASGSPPPSRVISP